MSIKSFTHIQPPNQIGPLADAEAKALPLVGNHASHTEIYLCHYSDDPDIKVFSNNGICSWLDGIVEAADKLKSLTSIPNIAKVNSIYIIRVGLTGDDRFNAPEFSNQHTKNGAFEYALNFMVTFGEFAVIPIEYDPNAKKFTYKKELAA